MWSRLATEVLQATQLHFLVDLESIADLFKWSDMLTLGIKLRPNWKPNENSVQFVEGFGCYWSIRLGKILKNLCPIFWPSINGILEKFISSGSQDLAIARGIVIINIIEKTFSNWNFKFHILEQHLHLKLIAEHRLILPVDGSGAPFSYQKSRVSSVRVWQKFPVRSFPQTQIRSSNFESSYFVSKNTV